MPHTVLLVDDEPKVLAGLQRVLYRQPYEILCANSAYDALHILQARLVDVVISDHDMPQIKGTEFLAKVHKEFPDVVRFMLTGKATLEVAIQAINEGAISRFFTKPCNSEELAVSIRQALQQRALMMEAKRLLRIARYQSNAMEQLERDYPGITKVQRDRDGVIITTSDDMSIEELLQQLRQEVARVEDYLDEMG